MATRSCLNGHVGSRLHLTSVQFTFPLSRFSSWRCWSAMGLKGPLINTMFSMNRTGLRLYLVFIQNALQLVHTPKALVCHARHQVACWDKLGVRRLAQGHLATPRVGDQTSHPPTARRLNLPASSVINNDNDSPVQHVYLSELMKTEYPLSWGRGSISAL